MGKIEFGYDNGMTPTGAWEGLGLKPGSNLYDASYYGAVRVGEEQFIVTKITEDKYNRYPELLDNFMVIPAIADMYKDGSGNIYLNQEQSLNAKQIEETLNKLKEEANLNNIDDITNYLEGLSPADRTFDMLIGEKSDQEKYTATAVLPEVFENMQTAFENCNLSFSELSRKMMELNNSKTY